MALWITGEELCGRMNNHASLKKEMRVNVNRFAKEVAVAAGFVFLCVAPGLSRAQSTPPSPLQAPYMASPVVRPRKVTPADDFAGLAFTAEQKAKIAEIQKNMKTRMDTVVKDERLSPEQKEAMLDGYRRMERAQVYKVLTPEQQLEVRKKILADRGAEQQKRQQQKRQQQKQQGQAQLLPR